MNSFPPLKRQPSYLADFNGLEKIMLFIHRYIIPPPHKVFFLGGGEIYIQFNLQFIILYYSNQYNIKHITAY